MTHKLRILWLIAVITLAASVMTAADVRASELHATTTGSVSIFGQQGANQHVFQTTSGTVFAKQVTFEATVGATAPELSVTATYNEATMFGQGVQIVMNGCTYTLTNKSTAGVTTARTAYVDIVCTQGKVIEFKTAICTLTIGPQSTSGTIVTSNTAGTSHDLSTTITVSGITYQNHGVLCFNYKGVNTETRSDGNYTAGTTTFQARAHTGGVLTTKNGHEFTKLNQDGALVGLEVT